MKLLFLPGSWTSPASRVRVLQYALPLRQRGHSVSVRVIAPDRHWTSPLKSSWMAKIHNALASGVRLFSALWILRDSGSFDVIFMNKDVLPEVRISFLEPMLGRRGIPLVFDFDDAVHLGQRGEKMKKIFPSFKRIIAGNEYLREYAEKLLPGRVVEIPTVVDTDLLFPSPARTPGPVRIGWSGSSFTAPGCLPLVEKVIVGLARSHEFEFVVISDSDPKLDWEGVKVRYMPWTAETETAGLQQIDIGLMPLEDTLFERGKCGMKAIQYMAAGAPAVVSPVGSNRKIVLDGKTGFHCVSHEDWTRALGLLLGDDCLRKKMGKNAREHVEANFSLRAALPVLESVLKEASGEKHGIC